MGHVLNLFAEMVHVMEMKTVQHVRKTAENAMEKIAYMIVTVNQTSVCTVPVEVLKLIAVTDIAIPAKTIPIVRKTVNVKFQMVAALIATVTATGIVLTI